jgi:tetratricopeptide (TPR) repeat protein
VSNSPFVLTGALLLKQQPLKAIGSADRVLLRDPGNIAALTLLGAGAAALGWTETAVFALEAAREHEPSRPELLLSLGRALLGAGRAPEAVKAAEELLRLQPANALAVALLRDAAVAVTLAQGRWEQASDFRGKQAPAG